MAICFLSGLPHHRHFSAVTNAAMGIFLHFSVKVRREVVYLCRNTTSYCSSKHPVKGHHADMNHWKHSGATQQ